MNSIFENFTQGGQTEIHKIRMIRQVIGTTIFISILIATIGLITAIFWHGWQPVYYLGAYHKAQYRNQMNFLPKGFYDTSWIKFNNKWTKISDQELSNNWKYKQLAAMIKLKLIKSFYCSTGIFSSSILICAVYWIRKGGNRQKTKLIKGYQLVTPAVLKNRLKKLALQI